MEKIEKVIRDTGEKCFCSGVIIETFSKHFGEWNGMIGRGSHTPSCVASNGYSCSKCGLVYGEPRFVKTTNILEEIKFELDLYQGKLKRKITTADMAPEMSLTRKRLSEIRIGNKVEKFPTQTSVQKPGKVPPELKKMKVGTIIYIIPNDWKDVHNPYIIIKLSKKKGEKTYTILCECIS